IDMLIKLDGSGLSHSSYGMYTYRLWLKDSSSPLRYLTNDNDDYLNSTKVLNKIKSSVSSISTYRNSVIKRNGVAVVLNLTSYDWNFDLVPAYGASDGQGGTAFFLIPDGKGNWIATDPRKDQDAITSANKAQNGYLIPLMRLIKYWNTRYYHCPTLPSYYLETLLINGLRYHYPALSSVKVTVPIAFDALATGLLQSCPDPKGLGPNLDASLGWDDRSKVSSKAIDMAKYARWALEYEQKDDHKEAYKWWGFIFPDFPAYG
ncbi:hypothetical protein SE17_04555, partial [Kouleothrix aurantiaca]